MVNVTIYITYMDPMGLFIEASMLVCHSLSKYFKPLY